MNRKDILSYLKKVLSPGRYEHTLRVEETALKLAKAYNVDEESISLAALFHDCAKDIPKEQLITDAKELNIDLEELHHYPQVIHGYVGAHIAKKDYSISDEHLLNAIQFHTTGRPDMSLIEKIIFIADYIEPGRKGIPRLTDIRREVYTDMDHALVMAMENTIAYLQKGHKDIHPLTLASLKFYKNQGGLDNESK